MSTHESAEAQVFGEFDPNVPVPRPSHLSASQFSGAVLPAQTTQHVPTTSGFAQHEVSTPAHAAHFGVDNDNHLAPYREGTRSTPERVTSISASGLYPHSSQTMGSLWNFGRSKGE
jgi:hypothetical protein